MDESKNPGKCESCGAEVAERCGDGYCRGCHKSLTFEECEDGSWVARIRAESGVRDLGLVPFRERVMKNDPEWLKRRLNDLMEAWAPEHARELLGEGWRLSDGDGLVWVHDYKPSLRLPDARAQQVHAERTYFRSIAGRYTDPDTVANMRAKLDGLLSYEEAAKP